MTVSPPATPGWPRPRIPRSRSAQFIQDNLEEFDFQRAAGRLYDAVFRGACAGFCLRGGLNLLGLLLALLVKKRRQKRARARNVLAMARDTLRYTAFLGSFAGVYVCVDEGIAAVLGKKRTASWRAFAAGLTAGPTILLTGSKARHDSLAIYILLRGITLLVRCGNKPNAPAWVRKLLMPTRMEHGDTLLMCLCTAQIAYSWIIKPHTMPPSFIAFLNHHGGHDNYFYVAAKELAERNAEGLPVTHLQGLKGTVHEHIISAVPCPWAHPGQNCDEAAITFFPAAYLRALPVYLPVYIAPAILVHRKALFEGPEAVKIWIKLLKGVARSSLFLAGYCTFAWRGACTGFQLTQNFTPFTLAAFAWTGGLATLFEKKSRRMELATYCLARCIESFGLCLEEWGLVTPRVLPPRMDVALFSIAAACIMHCYSDSNGRHRDVFRSKYLNVLDFIFGNSGVELGRISHSPSVHVLLMETQAMMRESAAPVMRRVKTFVGSLESHAGIEESTSPRSATSDPGIYSKLLRRTRSEGSAYANKKRKRMETLTHAGMETLTHASSTSSLGVQEEEEDEEDGQSQTEPIASPKHAGDVGSTLQNSDQDANELVKEAKLNECAVQAEYSQMQEGNSREVADGVVLPRGSADGVNTQEDAMVISKNANGPVTALPSPFEELDAQDAVVSTPEPGHYAPTFRRTTSVPSLEAAASEEPHKKYLRNRYKGQYNPKPLQYKNYGWHARLSSSESSEMLVPASEGKEPVVDYTNSDLGY
eukprot:jgi/Botrbrau1/12858/Bobra.0188s0001.1